MKRAWQNFAHRRMIISEIHLLPLKTNNYKQMKLSWQVKFDTQEDDYRFGANL